MAFLETVKIHKTIILTSCFTGKIFLPSEDSMIQILKPKNISSAKFPIGHEVDPPLLKYIPKLATDIQKCRK